MPNFLLKKNGEVVNRVIAQSADLPMFADYDEVVEEIISQEETPVEEPARVWTTSDVRSALTLAEKTKWDNDSAPEVVTAKIEIGGGLELAAITEVLDFLVDANVISADSKTAVLA